jgi:hypothetical protein
VGWGMGDKKCGIEIYTNLHKSRGKFLLQKRKKEKWVESTGIF